MRASTSITIDRPVSEVWDFIADISNMDKWVDGVSDPRPTSDGPWGPGSTFESKYTYSGKTHTINYEITRLDAPSHMSMRSVSGPFPFEAWVELREEDESTHFINTIDAKATNPFLSVWFAVLGPLLRMMMRKQLHKELVLLKARLEQRG